MVYLVTSIISIDIRMIWSFASPIPGVEAHGFCFLTQLLVYLVGKEIVFGTIISTQDSGRHREHVGIHCEIILRVGKGSGYSFVAYGCMLSLLSHFLSGESLVAISHLKQA